MFLFKEIKQAKPVKPTRLNNQTSTNDSDMPNCTIFPEANNNYQNLSQHYAENSFDANHHFHKRSFSTQNRSANYINSLERQNQSQYPHYNASEGMNSNFFIQNSTHSDSNFISSSAFFNSKNNRIPDSSNDFDSNSYMSNQADKSGSTPLQYLERLVKLPQAEVVDPKSIIAESLDNVLRGEQRSNSEQENSIIDGRNISSHVSSHDSRTTNNQFDAFNRLNKPSKDSYENMYNKNSIKVKEASFSSNANLSNSGNKQNNGKFDSNSNQIANKNMNNSDSPSSSCSSMSTTSSISSSNLLHSSQYRTEQNMRQSSQYGNYQQTCLDKIQCKINNSDLDFNDNEQLINLIDANNFELFDCLPELNSSVIEQLIDDTPPKSRNSDYDLSCRENLDSSLPTDDFFSNISNNQTPKSFKNEQPTYTYMHFNKNL